MLNRVTFVGRLGADPVIRTSQLGKPIANFSIACTEKWTDKHGVAQERTEWIPIVVMNEYLAGVAEKFLRKGVMTYVEGQWQTNKWTGQDGTEKSRTEVMVGKVSSRLIVMGALETAEPSRGQTGTARPPRSGHAGPTKADWSEFPEEMVPF